MSDFKDQAAVIMRMLANIAHEKGITHQEIADKTGFERSNVTRMFAGRYYPGLNNLLKLADAIGVYMTFEDRDGKTYIKIHDIKNT